MASVALDRKSPLPLWAQLEADLRARLERGDFDDGFPTDLELTTDYGCSRHTVREAVRHLNKTGLLRRERGRGTVVNKAEFEQTLGTLYSLFQSVESKGSQQTSEVLRLEKVFSSVAASHLEVDEEVPLVLLERIRNADGAPLAVDRVWLPSAIAEPLLAVDFSRTALYAELEKLGPYAPNQGWERLTPIIPSAPDREHLGMKKSEAAFFLERLGKRGDHIVEWRTTVVRGDRYRFVSDWSTGRAGSLRPFAT